MAPVVVHVTVHDPSETLHVHVSRDVDDEYYEIPEHLVLEYERTQKAYQDAQDAITDHIEVRHLQPQQSED